MKEKFLKMYKEGKPLTLAILGDMLYEQEDKSEIRLPERWFRGYQDLLVPPPSKQDIRELITTFKELTNALKSVDELTFRGVPIVEEK